MSTDSGCSGTGITEWSAKMLLMLQEMKHFIKI
jgi:hypothetical protein